MIHAHGYSPASPSRAASSSGSTSVRPSSSTNAATAAAGTGASRGTVANTYRPGRSSGSSPASNAGERRHLICMRVCTSASCTNVSQW